MSATIPDKSRKRNGRKTRERDRKKSRERNRRILNERKRRILKRIENRPGPERDQPMMTATNIHDELADRVQGLSPGGIGAMHLLARKTGLIGDIDRSLHLFKRHLPYHESDHVLNIAYNILAGGKRIEHLELRRNDEVYLNALGAVRIPDPTTAGDFCRRFSEHDVVTLMDAVNETRLRVWSEQPPEFFTQAIIEGDGTLVEIDAECKQGVDIAYDGTWSYHPLLISLANTAEPLYLVNRSGNRPSQEQAELYFDKAISLCRRAGFRKILLRGDTKFTQCTHLDRWDGAGDIQFVFGMAATDNLKELADRLPAEAYSFLERERESGKREAGESGKRDRSDIVNWAAPPTSERSSPGRGILISAHPSRATRGTIGRLQAQTFRDFLLPFRLAKGAASLHTPTKRFQFLRVIGLIDPLEPIRWHIDRPRRQQRPHFSRRMTALPQA